MPHNAEATAQRLVERLHKRQDELERERQITALPPVLKGAALVIPRGLLQSRLPHSRCRQSRSVSRKTRPPVRWSSSSRWTRSWRPNGGSATCRKTSRPRRRAGTSKAAISRSGHLRFIEVKGRHAEARDVIITKNEILASLNAPEAFILALVRVENGFAHEPIYVQRFFKRELGFAETAVIFNIDDLLSLRSGPPFRLGSQMETGVA